MKDAAVARIAEHQHALITRAQALACGLTDGEIRVRLRTGRWVMVRQNVYAVNGAPPNYEQAVMAACLAVGDPCAASRLTAARLWGLELPPPESIDVMTLGHRRLGQQGIRHHRVKTIWLADLTYIGQLPVTSVARTLVDTSGTVPRDRLGRVVDDALRRRIVTLADLRRCHERADTGPGRRSTVAMREVLEERSPGYHPGGSPRELDVRTVLVAAGLPEPVAQHRVRIDGRTYFLDLAYPVQRVGLEYDGWDVHKGFSSFHGDRARTRHLVADGWTIVPITSRTSPKELVQSVAAVLALSGAEPVA